MCISFLPRSSTLAQAQSKKSESAIEYAYVA